MPPRPVDFYPVYACHTVEHPRSWARRQPRKPIRSLIVIPLSGLGEGDVPKPGGTSTLGLAHPSATRADLVGARRGSGKITYRRPKKQPDGTVIWVDSIESCDVCGGTGKCS